MHSRQLFPNHTKLFSWFDSFPISVAVRHSASRNAQRTADPHISAQHQSCDGHYHEVGLNHPHNFRGRNHFPIWLPSDLRSRASDSTEHGNCPDFGSLDAFSAQFLHWGGRGTHTNGNRNSKV